ncbi:hypothetical protein D3C84_1059090 [compost metagenome]
MSHSGFFGEFALCKTLSKTQRFKRLRHHKIIRPSRFCHLVCDQAVAGNKDRFYLGRHIALELKPGRFIGFTGDGMHSLRGEHSKRHHHVRSIDEIRPWQHPMRVSAHEISIQQNIDIHR